ESVKLSDPVVLKLVEFGILKHGKRFPLKRLEKTAVEWAEAGVRTESDAEALIEREAAVERGLKQVLRRLGRRGAPSEDDVDLFVKWTRDWGCTLEAILAACAETTKGAPTMAYLDGILKRQHTLGKHDAPAIQAQWSREREESDAVRPILEAMGVRGTAPTREWVNAVETWRGRGFPAGSLLMAASQVSRRGGKLDDFERLLEAWLRQGLTDESAVEAHLTRIQAANMRLGKLFQLAGWDRPPVGRDRAALAEWKSLGISDELVEVAAEFANGANQPIPYMNKQLREWQAAGVASVAQARAEHAAFLARQGASAQALAGKASPEGAPVVRRPSKEVAEHRYTQRDYTDEDYDALMRGWSDSEDAI
ncbi:MAG: DnaD domain protein, partial [Oscillospiraceae bacterium]|nr:DnaD domain protein [Oscillospiraceae bacterium]